MDDSHLLSSVLFCSFCVVSGSVIQWGVSKLKRCRPPVSILWFLYGSLICLVDLLLVKSHREVGSDGSVLEVVEGSNLFQLGVAEGSRLPHNAIYFVVLPILLYDATQQVDWYHFRRNLRNGCWLAIAGVVLQVFIVGPLMYFCFPDSRGSFSACLMVAAAVGATDPIAVLSVLNSMEAPESLSSLFDCESLINDGTAVFLFTFFKSIATHSAEVNFQSATSEFFRLLLLGPLIGLCVGALLYRFVRHFRFHVYDITLLIIGVSYLVFFVAEVYAKTSGPLAIVAYGLYFKSYDRAAFESETHAAHKSFVKGLGVAMTSFVFIVSGITCIRIFWDTCNDDKNLIIQDMYATASARPVFSTSATSRLSYLWEVPLFYLLCHIARTLMVLVFAPLIRLDLGSFTWKECVLLVWGGLRGGVCLIIALLIEQDDTISVDTSRRAALYLASFTCLNLLINGTTFELLYKYLQPYEANPFKAIYLLKVLKIIDNEFEDEAKLLRDHYWLFQPNPFHNNDPNGPNGPNGGCPDDHPPGAVHVLELSKKLVPRLADIKLSSNNGITLHTVPVKKTLMQFRDVGGAEHTLPRSGDADGRPAARRAAGGRDSCGFIGVARQLSERAFAIHELRAPESGGAHSVEPVRPATGPPPRELLPTTLLTRGLQRRLHVP
ncbi:putative sodium/hydrogen exchanger [Gregarina niphandrodes]|uniref:Sodium/hydrogen exchanger n=1 Tax=Gregarina niphandrodes TaxID=110365 RepID=A0A023B4D4_GRENI|nr:putative sodium/hydrogen exchanger [Gregarina niphandrodes]EZG56593.1 putative sodium/hydrogen exchanger [Gregarina niphandrodes]|eukprot:XP_011131228.1 putative sodium/hydrogen exchanger [Gregarina niphandrodes]